MTETDAILWLDIGNTRVKYWLTTNDVVTEHFAELHLKSPLDLLAGLTYHFQSFPVQAIYLSSVLNQETNASIQTLLRKISPNVQFAKVRDGMHNLKVGYADPSRLGIDRWLQMLAVADPNQKQLVVGCGTALTIDILTGMNHQGGYILPSLYLQRNSLGLGTQGVKVENHSFLNTQQGTDTLSAVHNGILGGLIGAILFFHGTHSDHKLVLTGGDAQLFAEQIKQYNSNIAIRTQADLVFIGLKKYFQN